jgi:hypothetical protein
MIRPPSLVRTWETYYPRDSAFKQPPLPPVEDAPQSERDEYKLAVEQYRTALRVCREKGDWSSLLVEGGQPTKFVMGQVDREIFRELIDRSQLPASSPRRIGDAIAMSILFRLSCKAIVGWDKFEHAPDPKWDGWQMAPKEVVQMLDDIDMRIAAEIGREVFDRLQATRPF